MASERLDKILGGSGRYTRSQARALIQSGLVTVDGEVLRRPEAKVSRDGDIRVQGEPVDTAEFVYYMMNKPAGYESATEDGAYPAVTGLLPRELQSRGLFPVGRLDADVTGLLLLTDDGQFAHRVTSPKSQVPKVYELETDGPMTAADTEALKAGGPTYRSAALAVDGARPSHGYITVTEGKYHEVKNLLAWRGRRVVAMRRVAIGGLSLDESLAPGQIRRLTAEETARCLS